MTMQYQLPKICRIKFQFQKKKMNEWVNEWKSFVNTQRFVGSWLGFRTGNAPCPHLCCQSHWGYPDISQNETHSNRAARTVQWLCICGLFCINKLDFDFFLAMKTYLTIYFGGCSSKFLLLKKNFLAAPLAVSDK